MAPAPTPIPPASRPDLDILVREPIVERERPAVLFVHGLSHAAWCWENWIDPVAEAGYHAFAMSFRGHGASPGSLRTASLPAYLRDVKQTARWIERQYARRVVLVGHSLGGLVVQQALASYQSAGGVLVSPAPALPATGSIVSVARDYPLDAVKMTLGGTLPLHAEQLFPGLTAEEAKRHLDRLGPEAPLAQYGLLVHLPPRRPRGGVPVLVLAATDDRLIPISQVRATARRYDAELHEYRDMGHDLMLDRRWQAPLATMLDWLERLPPR